MTPANEVAVVYPKLYHNWSSRLGITAPDVTGPMRGSGLQVTPVGNEGTLIIAVDGTRASSHVELTIVTWDEVGGIHHRRSRERTQGSRTFDSITSTAGR